MQVEKKLKDIKEFNNLVKNRNLREWLACLIVIPAFFYMGVHKETALSQFFCFEIVLAAIFISYYLYIKSHRNLRQAAETNSNMDKVIRDEVNLLLTVRYWYVLPIFFGLIGLTIEDLYINYSNNKSLSGGLIYLVLVIGFGVFVVYLNEKKGVQDLKSYLNN